MGDALLNFDTLAKDNIRTLSLPQPTFKKPLCVILVGPPAAGKTSLTTRLADKFPLTVLKEEEITNFLAPRATIFRRDAAEVFNLAVKTIEHLVKMGKASVYDGNVKTREQRGLMQKTIEEAGGSYLLIYLDCPKEVCYERLQKHNLKVTRGETKGFILDKDYFEYEAVTTRRPPPEEHHVVYNCSNPDTIFQILSFVENRMK